MVASPTSVGDVLSLIGNAPVLHAGTAAVEKLRHAKSTFPMFGGGDTSPMMMQIAQDPTSLLSNAMGVTSGILGGMLGGMGGQLSSLIGGNGLGTGLLSSFTGDAGGMLTALTGAGGMQAALTSLTSLAGSFAGPMGMLSLYSLGELSKALPALVSPVDVVAPMMEGPVQTQAIIDAIVPIVAAGDVQGIIDRTAILNEIVARNQAAQAAANNASMAIATVSVMHAAFADDGIIADAMGTMLSVSAQQEIVDHLDAVSDMIESAKASAAATNNSDGGLQV